MFDTQDSNVKYFPVQTQIILTINAINRYKDKVRDQKSGVAPLAIHKEFADKELTTSQRGR
jgi:hypothetical protein